MECADCAGWGTTLMAALALILIIIFIIVAVVFFFFPSSQGLLEVRGINFDIINGNVTGGATGSVSESMPTGANNLYISQPLVGNINLTIESNSRNFVGMTIGIKNTTSETGTGDITLVSGAGVTLDPGGITDGLIIEPSEFAWFVVTSIGSTQVFTRLE